MKSKTVYFLNKNKSVLKLTFIYMNILSELGIFDLLPNLSLSYNIMDFKLGKYSFTIRLGWLLFRFGITVEI